MASEHSTISDIKVELEKLRINLKNPRIEKALKVEGFDLNTLIDAINKYSVNLLTFIGETDKKLIISILTSIENLVKYSNESSFRAIIHQFINEANFLIENAPKDQIIVENEFSKRYDKLIEILKLDNEEKSNLILETPSDKVPFQLFKNQNNSIIVLTKNGSKNSMSKEKLANIIYRKGNTKNLSYEPVIIEKILDNSIFDLIQNESIFDLVEDVRTNQNSTDLEEKIKKIEEMQFSYLRQEEENRKKLEQIAKNEIERQKSFNEVSVMEQQAKNALTNFENAQNSVLEKLAMKDSFKFWEEQGESYNKQYWIYIALSFAITVILLISTSNFLNNSHLSISSVISCFADNNSTIKAEEIITKKEIWQYGFLILSITLTLWFVRILMKIALSNYHLTVDAKERIVMIRTYLALMQEGKGFEQDDRKVILDNVFRPTNHGIIKDEASITLTDILSALKSK